MFKKKRGTHEINVQQAAPFCQCFLCTCTSPGWHSIECKPGGRVQRGSIVFSRQRVMGGSGDAKRRKKLPAGRTSSPLRHDHQAHPGQLYRGGKAGCLRVPSRARKLCAPTEPASERTRARAQTPPSRPPAAGKPGRGAGAGPAAPGRRRTPAVVVVALAT